MVQAAGTGTGVMVVKAGLAGIHQMFQARLDCSRSRSYSRKLFRTAAFMRGCFALSCKCLDKN